MLPPDDADRAPKPRYRVSELSGMRAGFYSWLLRLVSHRAADLLAYERHRASNHIQVLGGWITLGRIERAQDYLDRMVEVEQARSAALRALPPWAQLNLVDLWARAERSGITLVIAVEAPSPPWPGLFPKLFRLVGAAGFRRDGVTLEVQVRGSGYRIQVTGAGMADLIRDCPGRWTLQGETAILTRRFQEGADHVR